MLKLTFLSIGFFGVENDFFEFFLFDFADETHGPDTGDEVREPSIEKDDAPNDHRDAREDEEDDAENNRSGVGDDEESGGFAGFVDDFLERGDELGFLAF